jgi:hypothetical protein
MQRWLLVVFLFISSTLMAQKGYLYIKKNGKKVKTYTEGSFISVKLDDGRNIFGYINTVYKDSVYINNYGMRKDQITEVLLPKKEKQKIGMSAAQIGLITMGVGLSTAGMVASGYEDFQTALIYSCVIGYGPFILQRLFSSISFKRTSYKIGKKFTIDLFDLHFVPVYTR